MFVYYQLGDFSASLLFNAWIWSFPLVIVFRHGERFSKLCLPSCIGFTRYPVLSSKLTMFWLEDTFYGWMLLFSLDSFQPDNGFFFSWIKQTSKRHRVLLSRLSCLHLMQESIELFHAPCPLEKNKLDRKLFSLLWNLGVYHALLSTINAFYKLWGQVSGKQQFVSACFLRTCRTNTSDEIPSSTCFSSLPPRWFIIKLFSL